MLSSTYIKQVGLIALLIITLTLSYFQGYVNGGNRMLFLNEKRISYLDSFYSNAYKQLHTHDFVATSAVNFLSDKVASLQKERDNAIESLNKVYDTIYACGNGTCSISSTYRAAKWKLDNVGVWNKFLAFQYTKMSECNGQIVVLARGGHSVFCFEDGAGNIKVYTDTVGTITLGHISKDPKVIAQEFMKHFPAGYVLEDAYFEE